MKKYLLQSAAVLALAAPGLSHAITVDGVTWDETSAFDLQIKSLGLRETSVAGLGDELVGFGKIGQINDDTDQDSFCPGCELTFWFDGFFVEDVSGNEVLFSGGNVYFMVDYGNDFTEANIASAQNGDLWLQLAGHELMFDLGLGTLLGTFNGTVAEPEAGSFGIGYFDVVGGPAAPYLDTNGELDGSDFRFSSSFQVQGGNDDFPISGTGELFGQTQLLVPEPSALVLMGIGLLGFAVAGRRRAQ